METKFTKGYWKIDARTLYRGEEMIIDESGKYIAGITNRKEAEANSKLIAATSIMFYSIVLNAFETGQVWNFDLIERATGISYTYGSESFEQLVDEAKIFLSNLKS